DFQPALGERNLAADFTFFDLAKLPGQVAEVVEQNPLQPGAKLFRPGALEAWKGLLRFQKRALHQVRSAALLLEIRPESLIGKQIQIGTKAIEEAPQR